MSYILDALRKADADRERDPSRGIHAQPVGPTLAPVANRRAGTWVAAGLAVAAVLVAAWFWKADDKPAAPLAGPAATPQREVAVATVQQLPPVTLPPMQQAVPPQPATQVMPPPPPVVVQAPPQQVAPPPAPKAAPSPVPAPAVAKAQEPATAAPAATPAPASAASANNARIVAQSDLPPDVQRELPKLAISGGVYSENVAQRMLIVGGQVVNEGSEVAPGVVLEQIRPKTAVLRFRNLRYAVPY
ncbi:MAG: general secretion pathway protein GspB [Pseudomonadota bacterium]